MIDKNKIKAINSHLKLINIYKELKKNITIWIY